MRNTISITKVSSQQGVKCEDKKIEKRYGAIAYVVLVQSTFTNVKEILKKGKESKDLFPIKIL